MNSIEFIVSIFFQVNSLKCLSIVVVVICFTLVKDKQSSVLVKMNLCFVITFSIYQEEEKTTKKTS